MRLFAGAAVLLLGGAMGAAGMFAYHQSVMRRHFFPDPTGYVACTYDGSVIAGDIVITDGFTIAEFQDILIRACQAKRRVKPV